MRWILALHVLGIVVWFAASLDLSRLLGHHAKIGLKAGEPLKSYEIKTYFFAGLPGFLLTLATGLTLLFQNAGMYLDAKGVWGTTFHIKLTLVAVAIIVDQFSLFKMRKLHKGIEVKRGAFMTAHAILGSILIAVILLVMAKPLVG